MLTNVKIALSERRMRQADLALRVGVPPTTLSEYVNGRREMPSHLKARIAAVLGADPGWLFSRAAQIQMPRAEGSSELAAATAAA